MEENNQEVKTEQVNNAENPEIVIQESKAKQILKGAVKVLVVLATGVAGFFLGRASKGSGDSNDESTSDEGPKDE